jgi:hypothetical protein
MSVAIPGPTKNNSNPKEKINNCEENKQPLLHGRLIFVCSKRY